MTISSNYIRDLSLSELRYLQEKYEAHLRRTRGGFLSKDVKIKLLQIKRWDRHTTDSQVYNFFSDIKIHADSAFSDFMLLSDTLGEEQIKDIFKFKAQGKLLDMISHERDGKKSQKLWYSVPSLENTLRNVLNKDEDKEKEIKKNWKDMRLYEQPDSWKFNMVHRIIEICFDFLKENRFITSKAHRRLIEEVLDMLGSESHNTLVPKYWRGSTIV